MAVTVAAEDPGSAEVRALLDALDRYLGSLYPPEANFLDLPAADVGPGRGTFVVAREDGEAVGCGAARLLPASVAEVKRMYVVPERRGRGIGRRLLAALEAWAVEAGAERLVLETGPLQAEANRLYERAGFARIPCFGPYAQAPLSLCYEKPLP